MHRTFISVTLVLVLLHSSLTIFDNGAGSSDNWQLSEPITPTRSLSANASGGLYGGLITYEDVALIVNDNSTTSREIGTYFALKRGLPEANIINISVPAQEIITFSQYDDLANQVKDALSSRGLTDKINFMVTTKGVPLKVTSGVYDMRYQRYYESASVDSELMLLDSSLENAVHGRWWVDNPFAAAGTPFTKETYGIRLVTRLTGYTKEEAMGLVDKAETSFGVRGTALLDMDPSKNGSGGYKQGNDWMLSADTWLKDNGHTSYLDAENYFVASWDDTMAYYSWGSNDGNWNQGQMSNGGFEAGTGPQATSWTYEETGGIAVRTSETRHAGTWSLKLERNGTGVLRAYQDVPVNYQDHRYIADGRMSLSGVTSPGARILLEGYDQMMNLKWTHTLANRTGTRGFNNYQDPIENESSVVMIRIIVELLGDGIAYFDSFNLRVIRPHNEWLNGSIAETIVSTGGRSMTYGTGYGQSLVADIIRDGVTGIKGYTWEPFITAVSRAHILIPAYYLGYNLAESFWMGSPYVSWMGTVIGDPKCTPFINERADIGPAIDEQPIQTWVDEDGIPWVTYVLYNKGNRSVEQAKVELFMEGSVKFHEVLVDIEPGEKIYINLSSEDHQIIGNHTFSALLDRDDEIWEYDEKNNEFQEDIVVNNIPSMEVSVPITQIGRTEPLSIFVSIGDLDGDVSLDLLEMHLVGPSGMEYYPVLNWTNDDTTSMEAEYHFTPPWNATLGFYSLDLRYQDPRGSFDSKDMGPSIKVINQDPEITGNLSVTEVERGGVVVVDLEWTDPDTPDGSLEVEVYGERSQGGKLSPIQVLEISNWSASYSFILPAEDETMTWEFHATVLDRNGGGGEWSDLVRSYNRPPSLEVLNGTGSRITRLESAHFVIMYSDPEGLPSESIELEVYGPEGSPYANIVFSTEFNLNSDDALEIDIPGYDMHLGTYSLKLTYRDDEGEGGEILVPSAFEVYNVLPIIESVYISYPHGEGVFGETFTRSTSTTLTVHVADPDSIGTGTAVKGRVYYVGGEFDLDLFFDQRGENTFITRISTDGSWPVGEYGLELVTTDPDGEFTWMNVTTLFILDADKPFFNTGDVLVALDMNASVEISLGRGPGATSASEVYVLLYGTTGNLLVEGRVEDPSDIGIWMGTFSLSEIPATGGVKMIDDIGRIAWFNETLTIDVETAPPPPPEQPDSGDDTLLMILLILMVVILVLAAVVIIYALVIRKRSDAKMIAAPPIPMVLGPQTQAAALAPSHERSLPPAPGETQRSDTGTASPVNGAPPPVKEVIDGGSYHRPETGQQVQEPKKGEPIKMGTDPPDMAPPSEYSSPPVMEEPVIPPAAEPSNTPGDVDQPNQHVRDTNDPEVTGDPGQGKPQGNEGPGSGS